MPPVSSTNRKSPRTLILGYSITLLILCQISPLAEASGVFEFELLELQRLDLNPFHDHHHHHKDASRLAPIRVLVCLKEAFTSQLDGPCTFGNASLTINQHQIETSSSGSERTLQVQPHVGQANATMVNQTNEHRQQSDGNAHETNLQLQQPPLGGNRQQQTNYLHQESPLTNLVRIPITFRWTKSFTIILTVEQISSSGAQPSENSPRLDGNQHQAPRLKPIAASSGGSNKTTLELVLASNRSSFDKGAMSPVAAPTFIDRHVLTENEVVPNLEISLNKPWTSRFSRSLKSSLFYRFRVFCAPNYYGDGCTAFCRPRDDLFGHYNCSSTGQKICLEGWTGFDCDRAKCSAGCNQQHGYCDRPDTCQCRPGWTGPRCDECITYPGCQNGYCLAPWQCICDQNWAGLLCQQDLNYCGSHSPCKNNGTCQNTEGGRYRCHCETGFTGPNCETNLSVLGGMSLGDEMQIDAGQLTQLSAGCPLNPCLNGGTCFGFNTQLVNVSKNYTGGEQISSRSSLEDGGEHEHSMEDSVAVDGRHYRCQCLLGWVGDFCQWPDDRVTQTVVYSNTSNIETSTGDANSSSSQATADGAVTFINADNEEDTHGLRHRDNETNDALNSSTSQMFTTIGRQDFLTVTPNQHLNMKHLISGVLVASVVGVFLAALMLTWCCLVALEKNRFSFIQMNIIRRCDSSGEGRPQTVSTLRRMQAKIRDSLRCSSGGRIKPETKLNIENVLKPPPSYEESNIYSEKIYGRASRPEKSSAADGGQPPSTGVSGVQLVAGGALEQEIYATVQKAHASSVVWKQSVSDEQPDVAKTSDSSEQPDQSYASSPLQCPKHGHLYKAAQNYNRTIVVPPTQIEIEYQPQNKANATREEQTRRSHESTLEVVDRNQLKSHEHYDNNPNGFV